MGTMKRCQIQLEQGLASMEAEEKLINNFKVEILNVCLFWDAKSKSSHTPYLREGVGEVISWPIHVFFGLDLEFQEFKPYYYASPKHPLLRAMLQI